MQIGVGGADLGECLDLVDNRKQLRREDPLTRVWGEALRTDAKVLDLVTHTLQLPVSTRLVAGIVARFEDLRRIPRLLLLRHVIECELSNAELSEHNSTSAMASLGERGAGLP